MSQTLKNMITCYKNNLLETPNLQIIEKTFSDEVITDVDLYSSTFKNSSLINIKFTNVIFESSFFEGCFLENCVFDSTSLNSIECENCTLKNCRLINCDLSKRDFPETIFEECQFQRIDQGSLVKAWFESCDFIETTINGYDEIRLIQAALVNSKFSNSKKSIEFKGNFFLYDIVPFLSGILSE